MTNDARAQRYATRIADCTSLAELRTLLGAIIGASVPEPDFSELFGLVTARRLEILRKSTDEVWDRETG